MIKTSELMRLGGARFYNKRRRYKARRYLIHEWEIFKSVGESTWLVWHLFRDEHAGPFPTVGAARRAVMKRYEPTAIGAARRKVLERYKPNVRS